MQAQRKILIAHRPSITIGNGDAAQRAFEGTDLNVFCRVDASPVPTVTIGKNGEGLVTSDRIDIFMNPPASKEDSHFIVRLTIRSLKPSDAGMYFCRANNSMGTDYKDFRISVNARKPYTTTGGRNTESCCHAQNVTSTCIGACSLAIDLDFLLYRPECYSEFHKLMLCAAGTDTEKNTMFPTII